jgi:exfoliative toxin A/B
MCLAGYFAAFEQPNALLVYIMLVITVISYIYVSVNMVFLLRLKFYPTYAAFTFPYVISAIAFSSANTFLMENGYDFFSFAPIISKWVAVIVVSYVLIRYAVFLLTRD